MKICVRGAGIIYADRKAGGRTNRHDAVNGTRSQMTQTAPKTPDPN